jgi:hypothetical protein
MVSDTPTIRLVGSLHLRPDPDNGPRLIDDATFTGAGPWWNGATRRDPAGPST